jgi:UDP-2,3-diacylglucosamine pyrophosphatase LpxH
VRRAIVIALAAAWVAVWAAEPGEFHFALVGDRTGEAQPGVWERVWRELSGTSPAFALSVGDVIQGLDDAAAETQWRELLATLAPFRKLPIYFAPGNHDVWSEASVQLYQKHTTRPLHYGFDYGQAHFTVLDTSRSDKLSPAEMDFLAADLEAHQGAQAKFIVSHRPSWIMDAPLRNAAAPLHQLAKRYGVRWILAGHVHQLIHTDFDGVTYYAVPSSGGHLRLSKKYEDGWFFGWTDVRVKAGEASFTVRELGGRRTDLSEWGLSGLTK